MDQVVLKPPQRLQVVDYGSAPAVFLAGSIDQGAAVDWQARLTERLFAEYDEIHIFNPRRDDWDDTWESRLHNPQFKEQVEWELDHLERADVIAMYFDPKGKAPITLLELGLNAHRGNIVIYCPAEYWRCGNVEVIAERYRLNLLYDYDEFVDCLLDEIDQA
jgi:hypothetical protein